MSFSGKRYKRTGGSNLDDFFNDSQNAELFKKMLVSNIPTWCYTMLDSETIRLEVYAEVCQFRLTFKLGVEQEVLKVDGSKMYMTFTLEGDNILKQRIRKPNGSIAHFKREFHERTATLTITEEPNRRIAHVFYEMVD